MQFGMPITTTNGGINAVSNVILKPKRCMVPILHNTPIITTDKDKSIELNERKKIKRIIAERITEIRRNHCISLAIRVVITVLTSGRPLRYICWLVFLPKSFTIKTTFATTSFLFLEFITSLLMRTPISQALLCGLY